MEQTRHVGDAAIDLRRKGHTNPYPKSVPNAHSRQMRTYKASTTVTQNLLFTQRKVGWILEPAGCAKTGAAVSVGTRTLAKRSIRNIMRTLSAEPLTMGNRPKGNSRSLTYTAISSIIRILVLTNPVSCQCCHAGLNLGRSSRQSESSFEVLCAVNKN